MHEQTLHPNHPQMTDPSHSPESLKCSRRREIKQRLDELLENDFSALRSGKTDLLIRDHNLLVLEYVKGVYDEYNIQDPLQKWRISFTPSPKKTRNRRKIRLTSTQTGRRSEDKENESFDFSEEENSVQKDCLHDTTIRASLSYFDPCANSNLRQELEMIVEDELPPSSEDPQSAREIPKFTINAFSQQRDEPMIL